MLKTVVFSILFLLTVYSQQNAVFYSIEVEQVINSNAPNLHSFAYGEYNNEWVFIGGRTNGLHGFPSAPDDPPAFPTEFSNRYIYVYNPITNQSWSRSIYADLPLTITEQLRSTNMQFFQKENTLYIIGGYGKDTLLSTAQSDSFLTFNKLTAINLVGIVSAVKNNSSIANFVRQISDNRLQVTGGELRMINNDFYLVGGHIFNGEYRFPPVAFQKYTEEIKIFNINDDGTNLSISNYRAIKDSNNLHRRDLNVVPIILNQSGEEGLAIYGGVFNPDDLPWVNPVFISNSGHETNFNFEQRFSQYSCPSLGIYDSVTNRMSTVLFGGLSLYRWDSNLQQAVIDSCNFGSGLSPCIPYITDITSITRFSDGSVKDSILNITFPDGLLIGTNASFFYNSNLPVYNNGVIKNNNLIDRTLIGYIYGGLEATENNPRSRVSPRKAGTTFASNKIFKVFLTSDKTSSVNEIMNINNYVLNQNYPNPFNPSTEIRYRISEDRNVLLKVYDILGNEVATLVNEFKDAGSYSVSFDAGKLSSGIYYYQLRAGEFVETRKMLLMK